MRAWETLGLYRMRVMLSILNGPVMFCAATFDSLEEMA